MTDELRNDMGQRVTVQARQRGDQDTRQSLNAVRIEQERLAAWQNLDDAERHMVHAVVRATLRRLLQEPHWIPSSIRLGRDRLDVFFVVELSGDQVDAAAEAQDLDLQVAMAHDEMVALEQLLAEEDEDDGSTP